MPFQPPKRVYVDATADGWHRKLGTDYIAGWGSASALTGWTYTGTPTLRVFSSNGDLFSLSDHDPRGAALANTGGVQSIRFQHLIFGSRHHFKNAADILGYEPTKLYMRLIARFLVASANEDQTGFGLVSTVSATTTNGQKVCWLSSDSANFKVRSNTNTDTGAAVDTNWHDFLFVLDGTNIEWFIEGASQGTLTQVSDLYGCAFQVNGPTGRTNTLEIATAHLWYE